MEARAFKETIRNPSPSILDPLQSTPFNWSLKRTPAIVIDSLQSTLLYNKSLNHSEKLQKSPFLNLLRTEAIMNKFQKIHNNLGVRWQITNQRLNSHLSKYNNKHILLCSDKERKSFKMFICRYMSMYCY